LQRAWTLRVAPSPSAPGGESSLERGSRLAFRRLRTACGATDQHDRTSRITSQQSCLTFSPSRMSCMSF
jgi:hypothetical protein